VEALLDLCQSNGHRRRGHHVASNEGRPTEGFKVVVPLFKETHQHLVSLLGIAEVMASSHHVEKMSPHVLALRVHLFLDSWKIERRTKRSIAGCNRMQIQMQS
jgi:hypothetical protein